MESKIVPFTKDKGGNLNAKSRRGRVNSEEAESRLLKLTHDLVERVKELGCLYGISRLLENKDNSLEDILKGVVGLIPPAWQYPGVTCARIGLRGQLFQTDNFAETRWKQAEVIFVKGKPAGSVEVFYVEEMPDVFEGPFLKEERDLIHGIAERLGHVVESKIAEDRLHEMYDREKQLHKELRREMQSRIDFTRLLIHELKTPLTSLMSTSQLLLEETAGTRLDKPARYLWQGANGLNTRIEELNDVVRGEMGKLKVRLEQVDIGQLLQSLVEEAEALGPRYGVGIELHLEDGLPPVRADAGRVRQVVLNLINNACKYACEGKKISIRAFSGPDAGVTVEVRDYGPGISRGKQKDLFRPGYQIPGGGDTSGGLGIGLVLCKTLVELQGGKIWLKSRVGRGTSFFFSLPVWN